MPEAQSNRQAQSESEAAAIDTLVRKSGSSFLAAMRLMPEEKKRAMFALYSFCREVDDIADDEAPLPEKRRRLSEWRAELDRLFDGAPRTVIGNALAQPITRYGLGKDDFLAVIDGMEFDAAARIRVADWRELDLYCDRVAAAVGRLSSRIFEIPADRIDPLSAALGRALQLTNILRDLKEDAERDRLYIPADLLAGHGIAETDGLNGVFSEAAFPDVCAVIAGEARKSYEAAAAVIAECPRRNARPAAIMMAVYRRILDRLESRGWRAEALDRDVSLSKAEKIWVILRHGMI